MATFSSATWHQKTFRKLSRWLAYQYRATKRPVVTLEGVALRVGRHMSPRVERAVWSGRYEREELRLIREVLSPSDVVLEVGAGLGLVSSYCAKRVGSTRVFAYEANPDLEPFIRETYALNQVSPTLEMCAVGSGSGLVTLYRDKHLFSSSTTRRNARAVPLEVRVRPLGAIVEEVRPTLLIVDAEGGEADMFGGAQLSSVTRLIVELHQRVIGEAGVQRVRATLREQGFQPMRRLSTNEHLVLGR
jgi:FkbM family methyltransferase